MAVYLCQKHFQLNLVNIVSRCFSQQLLLSGLNWQLYFTCIKKRNQYQVTGLVFLTTDYKYCKSLYWPVADKLLSLLFPLCPAVFGDPLFLCGSGEAAVPERDPSCSARPCVALPVGWEGEERAEPRKVSGQRLFHFLLTACFMLCLGLISILHFIRNCYWICGRVCGEAWCVRQGWSQFTCSSVRSDQKELLLIANNRDFHLI